MPPKTLLVLSEGPAATLQSAASLPTGGSRGDSDAGRTAPEKEAPDAAGIAVAVPGAAVAPEIQARVNYLRYRLHRGTYRTIFEISSLVSAYELIIWHTTPGWIDKILIQVPTTALFFVATT